MFWGIAYLTFASFLLVFSGSAIYAYIRHLRHLEESGLYSLIESPEASKDKVIVQGVIRFWGPFVFTLFVGIFMLLPPLAGASLAPNEDLLGEVCVPLVFLVMAAVLWFWFLTEFGETYVLSDDRIVRVSTFMRERAIAWKDITNFRYYNRQGAFEISDEKISFSIENRMKNIWVLPEYALNKIPRDAWTAKAELHLKRLAKRRRWNL